MAAAMWCTGRSWWANQIDHLIGSGVHGLILRRSLVIRAWRPVSVDDALRQQVPHRLVAINRLIGREQVVECPIFADDGDDVLDRCRRIAVIGAALAGNRSCGGYRRHAVDCHCAYRHAAKKLVPAHMLRTQ